MNIHGKYIISIIYLYLSSIYLYKFDIRLIRTLLRKNKMDLKIYLLISILALFIDNLIIYLNCSINSILLFINLIGLYLMILQVEVDIDIRYGHQIEED